MGWSTKPERSWRCAAAVIASGIGLVSAIFKSRGTDWQLLKEYILTMAPETMPEDSVVKNSEELKQFVAEPMVLDSAKGSLITYLKHDDKKNSVITGTVRGRLSEYDIINGTKIDIGRVGGPVSDFTEKNGVLYSTAMGSLLPSEISSGQIIKKKGDKTASIGGLLHRPVHTLVHDLDKDGTDELIVSEFGDLKGKLSLLIEDENSSYRKQVLLDQPGTIRVQAKDMNDDGKDDLIALTSQGDESITILYQKENLQFDVEKAIRFSPVYGSSWFELVDYDGDGDQDIITVNGDNADETYVQKPYHGMRIHINDGNNAFEEKYFYPMNGATRVITKDFDADGDLDLVIGVNSGSIMFFENTAGTGNAMVFNSGVAVQANSADISTNTYASPVFGDLDEDGDLDLIVGSQPGIIEFFENTAGAGNAMVFNASTNLQVDGADLDVGVLSTIAVVDLDKDGVEDLVVGNAEGKLTFFKANSTNLSVSDFDSQELLHVFPNPVKDVFTIETSLEISKVSLFDIAGKQIEIQLGNTNEVDISNLASGIYHIKIYDNNNRTTTRKIIKK